MAAVFLSPVLVQVQQQIQAPVEIEITMLVEVRMHAQFSAADDLMQTATLESRIGNQMFDAGHLTQEFEKRHRVEVIHEKSRHGAKRLFGGRGQLDLLAIVEFLPADRVRRREFPQNFIYQGRIEKVVEHNVRKRFRIHVPRMSRLTFLPHAREW